MNANTDYTDLLEATATNTDLDKMERETSFGWASDEDRAEVHTDEKHIARRLLAHPGFKLRRYYTSSDGSGWGQSVSAEEYAENGHDARKPVYGVEGTLPVRAIGVKPSSPKSTGHAGVVTRKWLSEVEGEKDGEFPGNDD
jgi:hypothetical protein